MSTSSVPKLPSPGTFIESVKNSRLKLQDFGISINDDAIRDLLNSPAFSNSFHRLSSEIVVSLPLKFSSIAQELNVISITSLLNFASGYRIPLRKATGRGAWDTIRYLVVSLFLSSNAESGGVDWLSTKGLILLNDEKIASLLNINLYVETPHDKLPGVTVGKLGGPLYELVVLIRTVLNETGGILEQNGYPDFGSFVRQAFIEGHSGSPPAEETIVQRVSRQLSTHISLMLFL